MDSPRDADHALGLELQIEELVEQKTRAEVQGRDDDAEAIEPEISELQEELAETAERSAGDGPPDTPIIHAEHAEQAGHTDGG
ncbi:MAG: hypothetical protein ACRDXE_07295 [Acidimicrobiales bacterium]